MDGPTDAVLLEACVRRRFGNDARIENRVVSTAGGINRTVLFDVVERGARRRLVSRQETQAPGAAEHALFLSPGEQFDVIRAAHEAGVPTPEPVFEFDDSDGLGRGYVVGFVAGETLPRTILGDARFADLRPRLAARCGELLALIHAMPPGRVASLAARPDSVDAVVAFRDRYDSYRERHPALELGFRWLERHRPASTRTTFLHGDFRCGNLMVDADDVRAVLDWECAHLGSPAEDLGWLCARSWRFGRPALPVGGFGHRDALLDAYRAASGLRIDPDEVRYWEVFGIVRCAVYNVWQAHAHLDGQRRSIAYAVCGRNASLGEYDLLMTLSGRFD